MGKRKKLLIGAFQKVIPSIYGIYYSNYFNYSTPKEKINKWKKRKKG